MGAAASPIPVIGDVSWTSGSAPRSDFVSQRTYVASCSFRQAFSCRHGANLCGREVTGVQ